jgi:hypothetical protein
LLKTPRVSDGPSGVKKVVRAAVVWSVIGAEREYRCEERAAR